jgi:hypothetical protein
MSAIHEGGCMCGAVRYRVKGDPARSSACHCTLCQRRTGSAFGIGAYFKEENVEIYGGPLTQYEYRSDESGRHVRTEFCAKCGVTVTWRAEALPGMRAIAGGSFDDPKWFRIERHSWLRSSHPWIIPPEHAEKLQKSGLPQPTRGKDR